MHFRLDCATRMHLLWTHSNPVKLRAVCFWAPGAVAAFSQGQCYSRRRVPGSSLPCKPSTTCPDTATLWFGSHSLCLSMCTEHRKQFLVSILVWTLNTPPESSAQPGCLSFLLFTAAQPGPGKRPVSSCCVQLSDLQETVLLLSILFSRELRKSSEPGPCLARATLPSDLLSLMQKGRVFPSLLSTQLAWL